MNVENNRVWSAKNPQALHKNPLHLSTIGAQDLEDELQDHCSLKGLLLRKIIKIF
jgi:hypothetical protein